MADKAPRARRKRRHYCLTVDWPDQPGQVVHCTAGDIGRWLARVARGLVHHNVTGPPVMIEIREETHDSY